MLIWKEILELLEILENFRDLKDNSSKKWNFRSFGHPRILETREM